jgi:hypothetical protein
LADYVTELERWKACIRFLALASLYYDWCLVAWDENHEDDRIYWAAEGFEINNVFFRHVSHSRDDHDQQDKIDELELDCDELASGMHNSRTEVANALLKGFGGDAKLFISLWNSSKSEADEDHEILNDVTILKLRAWEWISEGCYPYR